MSTDAMIALRWMSVKDAALYSALSEETVRRLLAGQKLIAHRPVPGRILVDKRQLDALIEGAVSHPKKGRGMHTRQRAAM